MMDHSNFQDHSHVNTNDYQQPHRSRRNLYIFILIVIVAIIIGSVVGTNNKKKRDREASSSTGDPLLRTFAPKTFAPRETINPTISTSPSPSTSSSTGAPSVTHTPSTSSSTGAPSVTHAPSTLSSTGAPSVTHTPSTLSSTGAPSVTHTPSTLSSTGAPSVTNAPSTLSSTGAPSVTNAPSTLSSTGAPSVTHAPSTSSSTGAPSVSSSPTNTVDTEAFDNYVNSIALRGGEEFEDPTSYQSMAKEWLTGDYHGNTTKYSNQRIMQRYAIACIYYTTFQKSTAFTNTTFGTDSVPTWVQTTDWLTNENECNWFGIGCDSLGQVNRIDLPSNNLTGSVPDEIVLLAEKIEFLDLSSNPLENLKDSLDWIGNLTHLRSLKFASCYFEYYGIPSFLGQLSLLSELDISNTQMSGDINAQVFTKLKNLELLNLGENNYISTIPSEIYTLPTLKYLYIQNARISGNLEFIIEMPVIVGLWIDDNPSITGTIPREIGNITTLETLSLSGCSLNGPLPTELGHLNQMRQMWFNGNKLTGTIPTELESMDRLSHFQTDGNIMNGTMPAPLCELQTINNLFLSTDCGNGGTVVCTCCDCCDFPCRVI